MLKKVLYHTETCRFLLRSTRRIKTTVQSSLRDGFGVIKYFLIKKKIPYASGHLKQLRRIGVFLDIIAATLVYKDMIPPTLEYGNTILVILLKKCKNKLQVIQNKALRCIFRVGRDESSRVQTGNVDFNQNEEKSSGSTWHSSIFIRRCKVH